MEWSLITVNVCVCGGGGATKREGGGQLKFYHYKSAAEGRKSFSHAAGRHNKFWGSFNTRA